MEKKTEEILVAWINTFDSSHPISKLEELVDGLRFANILSQIIPSFQTSSIKEEAISNDYLKITNLKRIISGLENFYNNNLQIYPDVNVNLDSAVFDKNLSEIQKIIELILGAVLYCNNKVAFIEKMKTLEPSVQTHLMILIESVMSKLDLTKQSSSNNDEEAFLKELEEETNIITETEKENRRLQSEYSEVLRENKSLVQENSSLKALIQSLEEQVNKMKKPSTSQKDKPWVAPNHDEMLKRAMDSQQKLIEEQHILSSELERKDIMIGEMKRKIEELSKIEREARSLRDEVDILREKASIVDTLQQRLKKAELKAESINDLKASIKSLEEQNDRYLKQFVELEEEAKKVPALMRTLDSYKEQLTLITADKIALTTSLQEKETALEELKGQVNYLREDLNLKKQQIERLEIDISYMKQETDTKVIEKHGTEDLDNRVTDLSVKEKLTRLEIENKRLKGAEEKYTELENKLDDAQRLNSKYQKDIENLKKLVNSGTSFGSSGISALEYENLQNQVQQLQTENKKYLEELNSLLKETKTSSSAPSSDQKIAELNNKLKQTESKLKAMIDEKNKLEAYLKTAKTIIAEERAKNKNPGASSSEVKNMKEQIKKKDEEIQKLKGLLEESKIASEREQKLVSSALYDISLELQRLKFSTPISSTTTAKVVPQNSTPQNQNSQSKQVPNSGASLLSQKRNQLEVTSKK